MFKPTEGKWRYEYGWIKSYPAWATNPDYRILVGATHPVNSQEEEETNGRLMAAAPEMYGLLNRAFHALQRADIEEALRIEIDACLCHVEGTSVPGEEEEVKE